MRPETRLHAFIHEAESPRLDSLQININYAISSFDSVTTALNRCTNTSSENRVEEACAVRRSSEASLGLNVKAL